MRYVCGCRSQCSRVTVYVYTKLQHSAVTLLFTTASLCLTLSLRGAREHVPYLFIPPENNCKMRQKKAQKNLPALPSPVPGLRRSCAARATGTASPNISCSVFFEENQ